MPLFLAKVRHENNMRHFSFISLFLEYSTTPGREENNSRQPKTPYDFSIILWHISNRKPNLESSWNHKHNLDEPKMQTQCSNAYQLQRKIQNLDMSVHSFNSVKEWKDKMQILNNSKNSTIFEKHAKKGWIAQ